MESLDSITSLLRSFIGAKLRSVSALHHIFNSEKDRIAQELELFFSVGSFRIYGAQDGASICFSQTPLLELNLDEYGKLEVFSASHEAVFCRFIETELCSVSFIRSASATAIIGLSFNFSGGADFSILNMGDELFVFDIISEQVIKEEALFFEVIE